MHFDRRTYLLSCSFKLPWRNGRRRVALPSPRRGWRRRRRLELLRRDRDRRRRGQRRRAVHALALRPLHARRSLRRRRQVRGRRHGLTLLRRRPRARRDHEPVAALFLLLEAFVLEAAAVVGRGGGCGRDG